MYKQRFWMCHFKSPSMKRTILWSTGSAIAALKRYATMKKADFTFDPKNSTTVRYTNSGGKKAYKGSSKLKASQSFGSSLRIEWYSPNWFESLGKTEGVWSQMTIETKDLYPAICSLHCKNVAFPEWCKIQTETPSCHLFQVTSLGFVTLKAACPLDLRSVA